MALENPNRGRNGVSCTHTKPTGRVRYVQFILSLYIESVLPHRHHCNTEWRRKNNKRETVYNIERI